MAPNEISLKDEEPMPEVDHLINKLEGARWFTVLDMKDGFFQIKIKKEDCEKTAFQIEGKKYEFRRMPMGYKNAPFIFQRIMNHELRQWIDKNVQVYLDDVIIYAKTEEKHDAILKEVLQKLEFKNLKINSEKIQLKKNKINFLGYIIDGRTIRIPEDKRDKVLEVQLPKTKKDLQRFLGLINHHRRFINNYTEKTATLYNLLKDANSIDSWDENHTRNFNSLKTDISRLTKRFLPDHSKEFVLECDASNIGISAILYQVNPKNKEKEMIYPLAKKLNKTERNWGITEKELYAVVYGIKKFENYLNGKKFKIISDHMALKWLKSKQDFGNAKIQRWIQEIMGYDFVIEYREGKNMGYVDFLTRNNFSEDIRLKRFTPEQEEIIRKAHTDVGHRGADATHYELSRICTSWPHQKDHIKEIVEKCEQCIRNRVKKPGGGIFIETTNKLEIFGLDILEGQEEYILVGIDFYTRFGFCEKIRNKKATTIIHTLEKWFSDNKYPRKIIHDSGKEFNNNLFSHWADKNGIANHTTSPETPQSNGRVERLIRTLRDLLRKEYPVQITTPLIKKLCEIYNNTLHSGIGKTPFEAWDNNDKGIKIKNSKNSAYAQRFKKRNREKFIKSQIVAIRELPEKKENTRYGRTGYIEKILDNDSYLVNMNGKTYKRNHKDIINLHRGTYHGVL